jgi:hypothetical protein
VKIIHSLKINQDVQRLPTGLRKWLKARHQDGTIDEFMSLMIARKRAPRSEREVQNLIVQDWIEEHGGKREYADALVCVAKMQSDSPEEQEYYE